jgi:hypothetical protein
MRVYPDGYDVVDALRGRVQAIRKLRTDPGLSESNENLGVFLEQLLTHIDTLTAERDAARAQNVAVWGALQEMRWPDIPGIPYFVFEPGMKEPQRRQIPASEVVGIFDAIRAHVRTMLPWAVETERKAQDRDRLAACVERVRGCERVAFYASYAGHVVECETSSDSADTDDYFRAADILAALEGA